MCGIIGVTGVADASRVAYLGLYSLQHRGQESSGIVAVDGQGVARSHRLPTGRPLFGSGDPRGFRPLGVGRLGGGGAGSRGWVVASETCALDITGATLVRELEPGAFIRIHGAELDDLPALPAKPHRRCVFELVYFSRPDSTVFQRSVDGVRRALGRELAREHPAAGTDCVFSVPDSSNAMALGFSEESGIKLEHALIRNHYVGRTFIHPAQAGRMAKG